MKNIATGLLIASLAYCGAAQTGTSACSDMSLGTNGALNGFVPSPGDAWHQDITNAPVDPLSPIFMNTAVDGFRGYHLHPDFGTVYGIPYTVVDSSVTPKVPVNITLYTDDSDKTLFPLSPSQAVEGGFPSCPYDAGTTTDPNDHHTISIDRNQCVAYEMWRGSLCNGTWSAANGAIWDLTQTEKRPYGMTSVDAAGLSVFSGLIRYDEIIAGQINHAIRFTAAHTQNNQNGGTFMAPASHAAGTNWNAGDPSTGTNPIEGMRLRLRADFDISQFSQTNQIILKAMKQYGMILADNGSTLFFQGTPDARWNDDDLSALKNVPSSAFDVVQMNPVYDAASAPTGKAPQIASFTASSSQIALGGSVTLTPNVTNASYSYIDVVGFVRGPVTVSPTATTTYTLTSRNAFGTSTASVTVKVNTAPPPPTVQAVNIATALNVSNVYTFTAKAQLSNNTVQDVTRAAVWTSSNPAVATISNGTLLFQKTGVTTVTAVDSSVSSQPITVRAVLPLHLNPK